MKGQTGKLVKLGFLARYSGITALQHRETFLENVAAIVLFDTPSAKTTEAVFEEYAGELAKDNLKQMISKLKMRKFFHLLFSLHFSLPLLRLADIEKLFMLNPPWKK